MQMPAGGTRLSCTRERARSSSEADPYPKYVKDMSYDYPELRLLADFIEIGRDLIRRRSYGDNASKNE